MRKVICVLFLLGLVSKAYSSEEKLVAVPAATLQEMQDELAKSTKALEAAKTGKEAQANSLKDLQGELDKSTEALRKANLAVPLEQAALQKIRDAIARNKAAREAWETK